MVFENLRKKNSTKPNSDFFFSSWEPNLRIITQISFITQRRVYTKTKWPKAQAFDAVFFPLPGSVASEYHATFYTKLDVFGSSSSIGHIQLLLHFHVEHYFPSMSGVRVYDTNFHIEIDYFRSSSSSAVSDIRKSIHKSDKGRPATSSAGIWFFF